MKKPQNRMNFGAFVYLFVYSLCKSLKIKVYCGERGSATLMPCTFKAFHLRALAKFTIPRSVTKHQDGMLYSCTFRVRRCRR
nr:MAG TPA: hypothetical protein [Caudoviricetes sp.]